MRLEFASRWLGGADDYLHSAPETFVLSGSHHQRCITTDPRWRDRRSHLQMPHWASLHSQSNASKEGVTPWRGMHEQGEPNLGFPPALARGIHEQAKTMPPRRKRHPRASPWSTSEVAELGFHPGPRVCPNRLLMMEHGLSPGCSTTTEKTHRRWRQKR
jgi:hypothetical protein